MSASRLTSLSVTTADGRSTLWTEENDGPITFSVNDANVLVILNEDDLIRFVYAPMFWLTIDCQYSEGTE